jgi:GPH family glycoside/pentoside/hexuronide:cation symporter
VTAVAAISGPARYPAWSVFGAVLAAAGLPIYIFAPKFYADNFGVSLAALGTTLFLLRLIDVLQDPLLGWLAERLDTRAKRAATTIAGALMAAAMVALFAVSPPLAPLLWFALTVTVLFSAYSFLTIAFYAQGVAKAGGDGQVRLAAWRETGALLGVCLAAIAPTLLLGLTDRPFAAFAWGFVAATAVALLLMAPEWSATGRTPPMPMARILADAPARRLLILALVNATPLAVSSTLFLFFVESRLAAPGWEGPLLVLFFLSAALAAPLWAMSARRWGSKPTLLSAMVLAILTFGWAATLGAGDVAAFAAICILSGATIGADLTLLPAAFARRMATISPNAGAGFGLWGLMNKFTLAFAAVTLLPLLETAGFTAGAAEQPSPALTMLTVLYALVPSALKLLAIALLALTRLED